jgi:hypothetical protein
MKKFTKEEIDGTRAYFKSQGFEEVEVDFVGRKFSYFVLPQSLEPNLPDFVFRCTGNPKDGHVLGISDSVREEFRRYAVFHEYVEFTQIGMEQPNRCVSALDIELDIVPDEIKPGYVRMRRDFFRNLIAYCSKQPDKYTSEDLNEFKGSLSRLEEIAKELDV